MVRPGVELEHVCRASLDPVSRRPAVRRAVSSARKELVRASVLRHVDLRR